MSFLYKGIQQNDIQYNGTEHSVIWFKGTQQNDTKYNIEKHDTQHK